LNLSDLKRALAQEAFGMTIEEAHQKNICLECKQTPTFYSEAGAKEYINSGLCEPCFDKLAKALDEAS
jgi:hypothetical protein